MPILDLIIGESPLLEETASPPAITEPVLSYWITIDEVIEGSIKIGSISCELVLNGKSTLNCTLLNPSPVPVPGQTIKFIDRSKLIFGGSIQAVNLASEQSEAVLEYKLECAGWDSILERHLVTENYTDLYVGTLVQNFLTDAGLGAEGFTLGVVDPGPQILLVDADHVRASEYIRDIASAGGGAIEVGPEKTISFRLIDPRQAPFELTSAEAEVIETTDDLDAYCNRVICKVTGASGNVVSVTREDPVEITMRAAIEGGSGIYETFERITHPTQDDSAELARFGISTAFLILQSRGRVSHTIHARLRRNLLEVGQLISVNIPGMSASGTYQISRLSISDEDGKILFEIEATYSSKRQLNLDSMLKVIAAGKATIVLPPTEFANTATFTSGATWNVPGAGTVQVECDVYGAGAGGGGGFRVGAFGIPDTTGGRGGAGGKTVSFREYTAGTTLTIVIGTGGTGGAGAQFPTAGASAGNAGTTTYVSSPTENRVAEALSGGGGGGAYSGHNGPDGNPGTGTGDYIYVGGGQPGGAGGTGNQAGSSGTNGKVIIRY